MSWVMSTDQTTYRWKEKIKTGNEDWGEKVSSNSIH